ncbi:MAG: ribosomal L7Ae/L30e/S12e/Gadd45 family protein [Oscillospiraceae bacterium]|nr:ribosomal L7Ae/L30e/S12e/Gadd45 family protein [Oscillospiraceae bacterium]MBQ6427723.1 ribosomal L7Ae/L30e/S12e/Gadd45 family protein [Oscillospiraceae bacterium]
MRPEDLGFLGLMRRAGKLSAGEEGVRQSVRAGKAKLILLASDSSPNAQKRAEDFSAHARIPLLVMSEDKATLGRAAGVAGGAMFAVCDEGFAASLQKKLQTENNKE